MQSIYLMGDPRNMRVRYVGKSVDPEERHEQHIDEISYSPKGRWIQELRAHGLEPTMVVVEVCPDQIVYDRERHWIALGKSLGWPLTNSIAPPSKWRRRVRWSIGAKVALAIVCILFMCALFVYLFP